jgi:Flp pilus assembly protein TadG
MMLTLQIGSHTSPIDEPQETFIVPAEVVRSGPTGLGLRFLFAIVEDRRKLYRFLFHWKPALANASARRRPVQEPAHGGSLGTIYPSKRQGQALVEFCLIFPLLFLLVVNVVNFGAFLYDWISVANATRAGSQYWITGDATFTAPSAPGETAVAAVVRADLAALPNGSTALVKACTFYNPTNGSVTPTCVGDTFTTAAPPTDPEFATSVSATLDVKFTYNPIIPLWGFPKLGIVATLPSTVIQRQVVMRVLQ